MSTLLDSRLVLVTGKGGVGKTTVAMALAVAAADRGLRTILCEVGEQHHLARVFGRPTAADGEEREFESGLWGTSIDPQRTMREWLHSELHSRALVAVLDKSNVFQYFVAAAPGAKEIVTMAKIWELAQSQRWSKLASSFDFVVVDAPATGHALAMLGSPRTFAAFTSRGPIGKQAAQIQALLEDPQRTGYLAVSQPSEMAVTETLELEPALERRLSRTLGTIVVNGVLPRRFSTAELSEMDGSLAAARLSEGSIRGLEAGRALAARAREQRSQVARLRRHAQAPVSTLPFRFCARLELTDIRALARSLVEHL